MGRKREGYWRDRYRERKSEYASVKRAWLSVPENLIRSRAMDRMRYLRSKENPAEGEIEQLMELARKFPKRRVCLGKS